MSIISSPSRTTQIHQVKLNKKRFKEEDKFWELCVMTIQVLVNSDSISVWAKITSVSLKSQSKLTNLAWFRNQLKIARRTMIPMVCSVWLSVWMVNHWASPRSKKRLKLMSIIMLLSPTTQILLVRLLNRGSREVFQLWELEEMMIPMVILVWILEWVVITSA